jgi:Holliday junction resolvasome RuvABC ATP-dependent DNA helicase subunit
MMMNNDSVALMKKQIRQYLLITGRTRDYWDAITLVLVDKALKKMTANEAGLEEIEFEAAKAIILDRVSQPLGITVPN